MPSETCSRIALRDYQERAIEGVRGLIRQGRRRVLCVLPCGAGKTVIFAYMASRHILTHKGGQVLFLVHRRELVRQAEDTFDRMGIDRRHVHIAMAQTVTRHLSDEKRPTLIICDEAHHYTAESFKRILEAFPGAPAIGLTATPARLSGAPLGTLFDGMYVGEGVEWMIEHGWLSDFDYFAPEVNLIDAKWKTKGADYDQEDAASELDKIGIYGDVRKYLDTKRKTIVYCPTVEMSKRVASALPMAEHFDGETPDDERDAIMWRFREGETRVLCNCNLIGEGVDVPDCDCVMLLRPTKSVTVHVQQSMRCLRPAPGKRAVIYDFVGNVFRDGLPTTDHEWSLEKALPKRKEGEDPELKARQCKRCMRVYAGNARICPYCGFDNGKTRAQIEIERKAELKQIRELQRDERVKARTFEELVTIGKTRGYKNPVGWAYHVMEGRKRYF